jgi:outer membrane protein TolC
MENHPDIRKLEVKGEQLEVDRKLAAENLKPRLNLNYYWLDQPLDTQGDWTGLGFETNYKFGIDFEFPLFLRKERGKLNQTRLKQQENAFKTDFRTWEILNEVNSEYAVLVNTDLLIDQQAAMVENYQLILQAEQLNLENGESDLFKINIQLDKLIESETKLLKLRSTYQKSLATLYWQAGLANLVLPSN